MSVYNNHRPQTSLKLHQRTSLLDLPAAIWSKIGRLAVDNAWALTGSYFIREEEWPYQPCIIQASRALRQELLPYFLSTKIMVGRVECDILARKACCKWLFALELEMRRHVRGFFAEGRPLEGEALEEYLGTWLWLEESSSVMELGLESG